MFERRRTAMAAEHAVFVRLLPPQAIHPGFSQLPRPVFESHLEAFQRVARVRLEFETAPDDRITGNLVRL